MKVYLIRHAHALALGEQGIDKDEDRPLSKKGEKQSRQLAHTLQQRGVQLDALVTSPLVRAHRTAEIMIAEWAAPAPELIVSAKLAPGGKPRKIGKLLRDLNRERIGLVAHQPDMSAWAVWLMGGKKAYVDFAKGGVAHIDWDAELKKSSGALIWLITPAWYSEKPAKA